MKYYILLLLLAPGILSNTAMATNSVLNQLLDDYRSEGAVNADIQQGKTLWEKIFNNNNQVAGRSCASCHSKDLTKPGKHLKTNKPIKPMSPSINPQRLSNIKKVNKWFKRNCKWTMGRECTAQEKSDLLVYIAAPSRF